MSIAGLLWIGMGGLAYIYLGYPLLISLLSALWPVKREKGTFRANVSVVIVAHNEARQIRRKLENIRSLEGAEWIKEIVVASDGSDDGMIDLVQEAAEFDPRIRIVVGHDRLGKPARLNQVIPTCTGEILLLLDARQEIDSRALVELLDNFADHRIGVVSGELILRENYELSTAAAGIGFYWRYEKYVRRKESQFRSVPGATGAIYAIRKELFQKIPPNTLLDDVVIPMQAVIQGYRCVFEPNALAYDSPSHSPAQEAVRKRRTIAGNAQLLIHHPSWLLPWINPIWFEFVSHKLSRLVSPMFLAAAFVANTLLLWDRFYWLLFLCQAGCYAAAFTGWLLQIYGMKSRIFGPFLMFWTLNLTTVQALWDAIRQKYNVTWGRSAKS